jgi:hypothetical protein
MQPTGLIKKKGVKLKSVEFLGSMLHVFGGGNFVMAMSEEHWACESQCFFGLRR